MRGETRGVCGEVRGADRPPVWWGWGCHVCRGRKMGNPQTFLLILPWTLKCSKKIVFKKRISQKVSMFLNHLFPFQVIFKSLISSFLPEDIKCPCKHCPLFPSNMNIECSAHCLAIDCLIYIYIASYILKIIPILV